MTTAGSFTAEGVTFSNNVAGGGAGGGTDGVVGGAGAGGGGIAGSGTPSGAGGNGGGGGGGGQSGAGGNGGFGGGGGGGGFTPTYGIFYPAGIGGDGGFGGGGGGGGLEGAPGGSGGFLGGAGGGAGYYAGSGGGGAGLGGGIFSNGGAVTLVNDTFTGNSADGGAGANVGSGEGGAVFSLNGTVTATFVTFSADVAQDGSGNPLDGTDLYVLTFPSNVFVTGIRGSSASVALTDDILGQSSYSHMDFVANHVGGSTPTMSGTNDLISNNGPGTGSGFTCSTPITGDPMLGALASNGGPTETMALLYGSPALGAGTTADYPGTTTPITTDQRGISRGSSFDLGGYEQALFVAGLSPTAGSTGGGTTVIIMGAGFTQATVVDFGAVAGTNVTVIDGAHIEVTSPAHSAGTVAVTVTTPFGTSAHGNGRRIYV